SAPSRSPRGTADFIHVSAASLLHASGVQPCVPRNGSGLVVPANGSTTQPCPPGSGETIRRSPARSAPSFAGTSTVGRLLQVSVATSYSAPVLRSRYRSSPPQTRTLPSC